MGERRRLPKLRNPNLYIGVTRTDGRRHWQRRHVLIPHTRLVRKSQIRNHNVRNPQQELTSRCMSVCPKQHDVASRQIQMASTRHIAPTHRRGHTGDSKRHHDYLTQRKQRPNTQPNHSQSSPHTCPACMQGGTPACTQLAGARARGTPHSHTATPHRRACMKHGT